MSDFSAIIVIKSLLFQGLQENGACGNQGFTIYFKVQMIVTLPAIFSECFPREMWILAMSAIFLRDLKS